ncbi:hypothetical protein CASFOL_011288 [Castilleja foliolosa]|uniref:Uncharacterized protein n=1 Tax=Castilleja foliolosa TaxID=1961234 RepID=A0ABD3DV39_9LAMI
MQQTVSHGAPSPKLAKLLEVLVDHFKVKDPTNSRVIIFSNFRGRCQVLACEGSELKGYMNKQAKGKAIRKHMRNGGMNSFNFHDSPRMVPHVFRPEVQFLEMSIEKVVPRGKQVKDCNLVAEPAYKNKLTDAESDLLAKYFAPCGEISRKPLLLSFLTSRHFHPL